jgi:hypothetical protein
MTSKGVQRLAWLLPLLVGCSSTNNAPSDAGAADTTTGDANPTEAGSTDTGPADSTADTSADSSDATSSDASTRHRVLLGKALALFGLTTIALRSTLTTAAASAS